MHSFPIIMAKGARADGAKVAREVADFNTLVSRVRQPIESFFNRAADRWLEEKTGIQCAAKVRSTQGLLKHVFGALAAALFTLAF